jgi:hypothetical protein
MTTGFITYHSALGDARARLGDGCLRIALEAPLPAMRTLVYRLQVRGARDPIGTEEWSQIIDDLDELHEAEEATSVTNLRIETRKAMLEQMRKLLLAIETAEKPGALLGGQLRPSEQEERAATVRAATKATDRTLGAPARTNSFLYFDRTDLWIPRRVTVDRVSKTLVFLRDIDTNTVVRVKTQKTQDHGLVPGSDNNLWPQNGLGLAMAYSGLKVPS